jgi:hypothetical protein
MFDIRKASIKENPLSSIRLPYRGFRAEVEKPQHVFSTTGYGQ